MALNADDVIARLAPRQRHRESPGWRAPELPARLRDLSDAPRKRLAAKPYTSDIPSSNVAPSESAGTAVARVTVTV